MPKLKTKEMRWRDEVEKRGLYRALLERIRFHGVVDIETMVNMTGYSIHTCRKHCRRMLAEGLVHRHRQHPAWEAYSYADRAKVGSMS